MILFHPEFEVAEQETYSLVLAIVETAAAPGRMPAVEAVMEVKVLPAVEKAQTLGLVVHAVGMNNIHNHSYAHSVSFVHEFLELFRGAEA